MTRDAAVAYFDELSGSYATRYAPGGVLWHRHFFGARRRIALEWLSEVARGVVLDVGAGPGPLTASLAGRGLRVVAVDAAPGMARAAAAGGARAACGDALALPLRDGVVDAAVSLGVSSYVDDLPALLREMRRVVRPGGLVVVSVAVSTAPDWWLRRAFRAPARTIGVRGVLTSGVALRTRTRAQWRAAARDAGLELEQERGHDFTLFPLSRLLPGVSVSVSEAFERLEARALDRFASEVVLRMRVPGPREARPPRRRRPRVTRIIARLNVGGPALHTTLLTRSLRPAFDTVLATGDVAEGEIEATHLLARYGVEPVRIPGLGRAPRLADDVRAFTALLALLRRERPDLVHTHTAKAGALGRVAARIAGVPRVVHTFHGHVFHGYFGALGTRAVVWAERLLARLSDRVLAVSDEVAEDLVEGFGIAPRERVSVVPIGLPFPDAPVTTGERDAARSALGLDPRAPVAAFVGRLVPVKEPAVALDAWRRVRAELPDAVLLVAGGGPLLVSLRARADDGVRFLGWCEDVDPVFAAADVALLSSRNEGTPVALLEAAARGVPAVATRAGGVPSVVLDGETGVLAPVGDAAALADALVALLTDGERRARMGAAASRHVRERWSAVRLTRDLDRLYRSLLS